MDARGCQGRKMLAGAAGIVDWLTAARGVGIFGEIVQ